MIKDIQDRKVEDVAIAMAPRPGGQEGQEELWDCYLINLKEEPIQNVLVNSKGYGEVGGEKMATTVLRHFFEQIGPLEVVKIEPIQVKLFSLTNEYWISFTHDDYMYDKKYVFVKGSIEKSNFTTIPFINQQGVMIR
ncbi:hypothetical protein [Phaeodactylibacter luteus]|uniref:Uncharacterized protein n=1 Tax=Phaeodactylibacter luteus TaxID=1564516 RepID=A0A5C6S4Z7_9BACT|nr:hypothetical protein [Phaeodactylibacter luteus]TXB69493.1 hypothetical protein FRY97_01405 [Phaeodactylibacter luteus]